MEETAWAYSETTTHFVVWGVRQDLAICHRSVAVNSLIGTLRAHRTKLSEDELLSVSVKVATDWHARAA